MEKFEALRKRAESAIIRNLRPVPGSNGVPVLNEGGIYCGIWLEDGPHESLTIAGDFPEEAKMSHRIFYIHQKPDGQMPAMVTGTGPGYRQIQQVVPIAASAWELSQMTGDEAFLAESFEACAGWEKWLVANRDPKQLDLLEAWCEFDTGHDNSPRFAGCPRFCPAGAGVLPENVIPRLAPDLSANLYSSRLALADMAGALGRTAEEEQYRLAAERTRVNVEKYCFDPEREFYFDRFHDGSFSPVTGDAGLRVLGEHLPSPDRGKRIFERYILNEKSFWTPFPMPSIAADDPLFVYPAPENSWGGGSQALMALRTLRYFEYYGFSDALKELMLRWLAAMDKCDDFRQQMDPFTGIFSTTESYSPAMCVAIEFCRKLENC